MGARQKKSKKPSGTKAEQLLEGTTFFVDNCLGRLVVQALRDAGWLIEFHLDHFKGDSPDEEWLPIVGARRWVLLARDTHIRRQASGRAKVIAAKVRMFTLPGGNMTGEEMAERYLSSRGRMARILNNTPAPFAAVVHADAIDMIPL